MSEPRESNRPADEDRAGGRNTLTRQASGDLASDPNADKIYIDKMYAANLKGAHEHLRKALRAWQDGKFKHAVGYLNLAERDANRAKLMANNKKRKEMSERATSDSPVHP